MMAVGVELDGSVDTGDAVAGAAAFSVNPSAVLVLEESRGSGMPLIPLASSRGERGCCSLLSSCFSSKVGVDVCIAC